MNFAKTARLRMQVCAENLTKFSPRYGLAFVGEKRDLASDVPAR